MNAARLSPILDLPRAGKRHCENGRAVDWGGGCAHNQCFATAGTTGSIAPRCRHRSYARRNPMRRLT